MKRNISILLAGLLLLSATLACGNTEQAPEIVAPEQTVAPTSIPAPTPYPTYTPYPTLVPQPTLEPTSIPEPTEAPRDGPSLADEQFVLGIGACLDDDLRTAMAALNMALEIRPVDLPAIYAAAADVKTVAEQQRVCLDGLPYPDNPLLQDVHRLYGLGLDETVHAMDYMMEFCEAPTNTGLGDLAAGAMDNAGLYFGQAAEAMELYAAGLSAGSV